MKTWFRFTKKDIEDLKVIGSARPVKTEDLLGDNFPANTIDRLAEYRQEAVTKMREEE